MLVPNVFKIRRYSLNLYVNIRSLANDNKIDRIVGDTFIRSAEDGRDVPYQFIIGKGKVASEVTITMEAIAFGLLKSCELLETLY